MTVLQLPCTIARGGTSKGVFIAIADLPDEAALRDRIILALFGSPDARQIDGLGGADPLTSKVALVGPSAAPAADVDYLSGEVGIVEARINYGTMCGNLASAVGLFAIARGMVPVSEPVTTVRIRNLNSGKFLRASIPVANGRPLLTGAHSISGVPGTAAEIRLAFEHPAGSVTGRLLPSGSAADRIRIGPDSVIDCSIVDSGTLYAFVRAIDLDIQGTELPDALNENTRFRSAVECVREAVAALLDSCTTVQGGRISASSIKVAVVTPPCNHPISNGRILAHEADVVARIINRYKIHKAYAVSGAICISAAAITPGTIVNEIHAPSVSPLAMRIAHPGGVLDALTAFDAETRADILYTEVSRTARILMSGVAEVAVRAG